MRRKRPNRELKNQHHPGLSVNPKPLTGDQLLEQGSVLIGTPAMVQKLADEFMATERILNRQRRNRTMGRRIAWTAFWLLVIGAVVLCVQALDHTLSEVPITLGTP